MTNPVISPAGQGDAEATAGTGRGIIISTMARPTRTKQIRLDAEQLIQQSAIELAIILPTMLYGAPGDRNLSQLLTLLRRVPVPPMFGGGQHLQQRVYVHVADLTGAVLVAAVGNEYDVAGPEPLTLANLQRVSARRVTNRTRFDSVPLAPTVSAARCHERLGRHPRIRAEQLQCLAEDKAFTIDDAAARDLVKHANVPQSNGAAKGRNAA